MVKTNRIATLQEVRKVECAIDAFFEGLSLPAEEYFEALWNFLTVSEDIPRWVILRGTGVVTKYGESAEMMRLSNLVDDNKYALRYLLDIIKRRLQKARTLSKRICSGEASYTTAGHGLLLAQDYRTAVGVFSLYHSGDAVCRISEAGDHLWFEFPGHSEQYLALEYSLVTEETGANTVAVLFGWLKSPDSAPDVAKQIGDSVVAMEGDRLVYEFNRDAAEILARTLPSVESWTLVPPNWMFPWGSRIEVMALWNSLLIRCAYHVLAINFGASRMQIVGGGLDDVCLRIKRGELVQDIKRISGAPLNRIVKFVQGLTYGQETQTPDPALQPLIPCGRDEFLVPCLHIVSSRGSRNLLSLHARIDKDSFNSQSALFEDSMVEDVAAIASGRFSFVRTQFNFGPAGEIDLVIVDERSATILIGELRWMIPPGDSRETINRIRACREKVTQVGKKIRAVTNDIVTFLKRLGWDGGTPVIWAVHGFVITENFVFRSSNIDIPMFPLAVLRVGLKNELNAQQLYSWLKSESWLPKKDQHFEIAEDEVRFGRYAVTQYSLANPKAFEYVREFLPTTLKAFMAI